MTPATADLARSRTMWLKVPQVTAFFWIIKVLATTIGETAADYLSEDLDLGLTNTSIVMSALLVVALIVQLRARRYVPAIYWVAVVLISVVGTLVTDNLVDNLGVSLGLTSVLFSAALAATFGAWFASEGTLSIHSIDTTRREAFYWLAILFTFALGTAAGDLVSEGMDLGYLFSALCFAVTLGVVVGAYVLFGLNGVVAFWLAYILTRPLGASIGDYLSQARNDGGLGLGPTATSAAFLLTIVGLVLYLTRTGVDATTPVERA